LLSRRHRAPALAILDVMRLSPRPSQPRASAAPAVVVPLPAVRDDAALLEGLHAGKSWAKAALFARFGPQVQRVLRKILGPQPRLEMPDVIHDVFVQALGSVDQLREPAAMSAWMHAITTRTAFRLLRVQRAKRWLQFWEPAELPEVACEGVDPEMLEAYRRTYAVLDRMPAAERIAFALRYIEGMELTPLALACGVSLATIKRRLLRAEKRFAAAARRDDVLRGWLEEGDRWTTT
jgi:RNA polymerase sigma-70 factor (ECF subfamily)